MNHIYRLKFNKSRQMLTVVSEIARGMIKGSAGAGKSCRLGQLSKLACALLPLLGFSQFTMAADLPSGATVVAGQATVQSNHQSMLIQQHTDKLITNWQTFDIGKDKTVEFKQPSASSMALNRVTGGGQASQILGSLKANGQVFLINPKGVLFGKDAQVNVGALVASSGQISNADFLKNNIKLSDLGNGEIINQGNLKVNPAGYIVLAAPVIKNSGVINASNGKVALAAGNSVTLYLDQGHLLSVDVNEATLNSLIENKGLIAASNGQVYLTAKGSRSLSKEVINLGGSVDVSAIRKTDQGIFIDGGDSGVTQVSGQLLANGAQQGGKIVVTGRQVVLSGKAHASGEQGGEVYIGGGWQGKDPAIRNASQVVLTDSAVVNVSGAAARRGTGGTAVLWSEQSTAFGGRIDFGNDGKVETSSRGVLAVSGQVDGRGGSWLLDPRTITISDTLASVTPTPTTISSATDSKVTSDPGSTETSNYGITTNTLKTALNAGTSVSLMADILNLKDIKYDYHNTSLDSKPILTLTGKTAITATNVSIRPNSSLAANGLSITLKGGNVSFTDSIVDLRGADGKADGAFNSNSQTFVATNSTLVAGTVNITAETRSVFKETKGAGSNVWEQRSNTNAVWLERSRIAATKGDLIINGTIHTPNASSPLNLINAGIRKGAGASELFADGNSPELKAGVADSTKITRDKLPSENAVTIINSMLESKAASADDAQKGDVNINGKSAGEFSGVRLLGSRLDPTSDRAEIDKLTPSTLIDRAADVKTLVNFFTAATSLNGVSIKAHNNVTIYGESKGTSALQKMDLLYPGEERKIELADYLYTVFAERGSLYLEGNVNVNSQHNSLMGNNLRTGDGETYRPTGFAFYNLNGNFTGPTDLHGYSVAGLGIAAWSKSTMSFNNLKADGSKIENHIYAISQQYNGLDFINFNYAGTDFTTDQTKATTEDGIKNLIKENTYNLNLQNADFDVYAMGGVAGFLSGGREGSTDAVGKINEYSNSIKVNGTGNINVVGVGGTGVGFSVKAMDNTGLQGFINITGISNSNSGVIFSRSVPGLGYKVVGHVNASSGSKDAYGVNIFGYSNSALNGAVEITTSLTPNSVESQALAKLYTQINGLVGKGSTFSEAIAMPEIQDIKTKLLAAPFADHIRPWLEGCSGTICPLPNLFVTGINKTEGPGVKITPLISGADTLSLNGIDNITGISYGAGAGVSISGAIQLVSTMVTGISQKNHGIDVSGGTADNPVMLILSKLQGASGDNTGNFAGVNIKGNLIVAEDKYNRDRTGLNTDPIVQGKMMTSTSFTTTDLDKLLASYKVANIDEAFKAKFKAVTVTEAAKTGADLKTPADPTISDTTAYDYDATKPKGIILDNAAVSGLGELKTYDADETKVSTGLTLINGSTISGGIPIPRIDDYSSLSRSVTDVEKLLIALNSATELKTVIKDKLVIDAKGKVGADLTNNSTLTHVTLNAATASTSVATDAAVRMTGNVSLGGDTTINANNTPGGSVANGLQIKDAEIKQATPGKYDRGTCTDSACTSTASTEPTKLVINTSGSQNVLSIDNSVILQGFAADETKTTRLIINASMPNDTVVAENAKPLVHIGNAILDNTDIKVDTSSLATAAANAQNLVELVKSTEKKTGYDKLMLNNSTLSYTGTANSAKFTGFFINNNVTFTNGAKIIADMTYGGTDPLAPAIRVADQANPLDDTPIDAIPISLQGDLASPDRAMFNPDKANIQLKNNAWLLFDNNINNIIELSRLSIAGESNTRIQKPNKNTGNMRINDSLITNKVGAGSYSLMNDGQVNRGIFLTKVALTNSTIYGESTDKGTTAVALQGLGTITNSSIVGNLTAALTDAPETVKAVSIDNPADLDIPIILQGSKILAQGPLEIKTATRGVTLAKNAATASTITANNYVVIDTPYIGAATGDSSTDNKLIVEIPVTATVPDVVKNKADSAALTFSAPGAAITLGNMTVNVDSKVNGFKNGVLLTKPAKVGILALNVKAGDKLAVSGISNLQDANGNPISKNVNVTEADGVATIKNSGLVITLTKPSGADTDFTDGYTALKAGSKAEDALSPLPEIDPGSAGVVPSGGEDTPPSPGETPSPSPGETPSPSPGETPSPTPVPETPGSEITPPADDPTPKPPAPTPEKPSVPEKPEPPAPTPEKPSAPEKPEPSEPAVSKPDQLAQQLAKQVAQANTVTANMAANNSREFSQISMSVEIDHPALPPIEVCDIDGKCTDQSLYSTPVKNTAPVVNQSH